MMVYVEAESTHEGELFRSLIEVILHPCRLVFAHAGLDPNQSCVLTFPGLVKFLHPCKLLFAHVGLRSKSKLRPRLSQSGDIPMIDILLVGLSLKVAFARQAEVAQSIILLCNQVLRQPCR